MRNHFFYRIMSICISCVLLLSSAIPVYASQLPTVEEQEYLIFDNFNETIQMTNEEALELYLTFTNTRYAALSANDAYTVESLEAFIDYAVSEGIIEDTAEQRATLDVATIRGLFTTVADTGRALGYTTAATLLKHSLQDNPSNFIYGSASTYARQIQNSSECNQIASTFGEQVLGTSNNKYTLSGTTTLNSTTDLHLSYNRVSYTATGYNGSEQWRVNIVFKDTYDFQKQDWLNEMTDNVAVTIINNYAAHAQEIGAIVPYDINITVSVNIDK